MKISKVSHFPHIDNAFGILYIQNRELITDYKGVTMKKQHIYKRLILILFIIVFIVSGIVLYHISTPIFQVRRAFHNTFSSLNDTMLSTYWSNDRLSSVYQQDFTVALKDCSCQNMPVASYLGGLQVDCSAITDCANMHSYGNYVCAYSAMPLINGDFLLTENTLQLSSPALFEGSLSFPCKNFMSVFSNPAYEEYFSNVSFANDFNFISIPSVFMAVQPEVYQLYQNFYSNDFVKTNDNVLVQTDNLSFDCTSYQILFHQDSGSALEHILSIIGDSALDTISADYVAQHPELEPFTDSSLISNAMITLSIDSQHIIRQLQCIICSDDNRYYYTFVLTGDATPLSSWILTCASTDSAAEKTQSYCKLIKKEPCAYEFFAQGSDSSVVDNFTFSISQKHGFIHDYSNIDYRYQVAPDSVPSLETVLYHEAQSTDYITEKSLICNGSIQYYMNYNSSDCHFELNIESLTIQTPDNNLTLAASIRYRQKGINVCEPITMPEPVYSLESLSKEQWRQLQHEIQNNIVKSSIGNMILSVLH